MKLTDDQYQQLIKHIQDNWKAPVACPVCGKNDWSVSQEVYEIREFHGGSMVLGAGSIIPVNPVTCKVCGNVVWINPMVAGISLKGGSNG